MNFEVVCDQRRTRLLNNIPPVRFELTSPYTDGNGLTQKRLDMRRKAEILKYSGNKMASQTGKMTKRMYWSKVLSGTYTAPNAVYDPSGDLAGYETCDADKLRPVPTSSSGVPGPVEYLYEDPDVPLYNYLTGNRSYPFDQAIDSRFWTVQTNADTLVAHNTSTSVVKLFLKPNVDKDNYFFHIISPAALFVSGNILNNNVVKSNPITVSITYIAVEVLFSGTQVQLIQQPILFSPLVFDVSGCVGAFRAVQYLGNLEISHLALMTSPGFNYDINLIVRMSITGQSTSYFSSIQPYFYANVSPINNIVSNCHLISTPAPSSLNNGFVFEGR